MRKFLLLLFPCFLLSACSEDEEALPPYVQGLAELRTDGAGRGATFVPDDGASLSVANAPTGLKADTTYRILAAYLPDAGTVHLTSYAPVLAPEVGKYASGDIVTDPLSVVACWQAGGYVNFRLSLKVSAGKTHYFGFHQTGYVRHADGSRTLEALLIHDQNGDPLYYTREAYLSLPLRPLDGLLQSGRDSVSVSVQTFDGIFMRTFAF